MLNSGPVGLKLSVKTKKKSFGHEVVGVPQYNSSLGPKDSDHVDAK